MKKLKLSLMNIEGAEVLSREQLRKVVGGMQGTADTIYGCKCSDGTMATSDTGGYDPGLADLCPGSTCGYWVCGNPGVTCGEA